MTGTTTPTDGETLDAGRPFHRACTGNGQLQQQQMSQIEEDLLLLRRQQQQAQGRDL